MSYRRSTLYRFRGLVILALLACSILILSSHHYATADETTRAASILSWMKDGGYEMLLPTAQDLEKAQNPGSSTPAAKTTAALTSSSDTSRANSFDYAPQNEKVLRFQSELKQQHSPMDPLTKEFMSWRDPAIYQPKQKPPPKPPRETVKPIADPFPLLSRPIEEVRKKLVVPEVNRPPKVHVPEQTPLLIGFTRNWPQLLQCVSSYITAGWPAEDIYIVENTGVMHSNRDNKLTLQNPFYLNHTQLHMLGVNVIVSPTLLSFAQLQNYYAWIALENDWPDFFWSHQDVVAFSFEKEFRDHLDDRALKDANYSLYARAVAILRYLRQPGIPKWANHFFAYDHLTLVHRDAVLDIGGWDTHIPFYSTDCDFYLRQKWAGYFQGSTQIGIIIDTSTVLDDFAALFRVSGVHATFQGDPGPSELADAASHDVLAQLDFEDADLERRQLVDEDGETIEHLVDVAYRMQAVKYIDGGWWRNLWQLRQGGGQGEPFYRDQEGFQVGLDTMIETGRRVFADKWGHRGCDIFDRTAEDAWRLQRDWNPTTEGQGFEGFYW
ncbi:unnamed protein product [Discula destructiva]